MARKRKPVAMHNFVLFVIAVLLFGTLIGVNIPKEEVVKIINIERGFDGSQVVMNVPAVDNNGKGIVTTFKVQAIPGEGRTLTDIDILSFLIDTQHSIRISQSVASRTTRVSTENLDLIYDINAGGATVVGGPSAGAALTIATIAVLEDKPLRENVMITGTIEEDGRINRVGGVLEKAIAAKQTGAVVFLVPDGESTEIRVKAEEACKNEPDFVYCHKIFKRKEINIGEFLDLDVIEVSNVKEALPYFFD